MAYKRYFYRNGKKFGPYYYESYRDKNGKVKKKYVGVTDPKSVGKNKNSIKLGVVVALAVSLLLIAGYFIFFQGGINR